VERGGAFAFRPQRDHLGKEEETLVDILAFLDASLQLLIYLGAVLAELLHVDLLIALVLVVAGHLLTPRQVHKVQH